MDFTGDATYSPSFAFGYAESEKTARLYPDERGRKESLGESASGEFVLCVDRDGEDWLKVCLLYTSSYRLCRSCRFCCWATGS